MRRERWRPSAAALNCERFVRRPLCPIARRSTIFSSPCGGRRARRRFGPGGLYADLRRGDRRARRSRRRRNSPRGVLLPLDRDRRPRGRALRRRRGDDGARLARGLSRNGSRAAGTRCRRRRRIGGMGLPLLLAAACTEMWNAANMAFALCPLLGQGAIEALEAHASEALKAAYLPKMISGEWTATMNLTEPQAGSDLAHAAHPRRARRRRHLSHLRPEDLHHLWRA